MMNRRDLAIVMTIHLSVILFVFLVGGYIQLLLQPHIPYLMQNPVFSAVISETRGLYELDEAVLGFFVFAALLPLDFAILYSATRELVNAGDISKSLERGIGDYFSFFAGFFSIYFLGLIYPFVIPIFMLGYLKKLEDNVPWFYLALSTTMFCAWLLPIGLTSKIQDMFARQFISFILLMGAGATFLAHALLMKHYRRPASGSLKLKE